MSSSSRRPKRKAAENATKNMNFKDTDESDDSEVVAPVKRMRKKVTTTEQTTKNASGNSKRKLEDFNKPTNASESDVINTPAKKVRKKNVTKKTTTAAANKKAANAKQVALDKSDEDAPRTSAVDSAQTAKTDSNAFKPKTRNSFWERRKVWTIPELLAETTQIEQSTAHNIVQLFESDNTIPFICRYRRDLVNQISPEQLRQIKQNYNEIINLRKKAENIVQKIEKDEGHLPAELREDVMCAKSMEELEHLYAPYKPANKGTLAERAKAQGLEKYADALLYDDSGVAVHLQQLYDCNNPELDSIEKVKQGICHIMSHNISKHTGVLEELRKLQHQHQIRLNCKRINQRKNEKNAAEENADKYELYFNFEAAVNALKPHQVLAINRAEKSKFINVKLIVPTRLERDLRNYVERLFLHEGTVYELRKIMFDKAFEECYNKKLLPLLTRHIRAELTETAMKAAIDVFAKNLKQLLLMSPLKGERILGIDPGFRHGCKYALITETANVLETGVLYPHTTDKQKTEQSAHKLAEILQRHDCHIIALGNGTACRETECWLQQLQRQGILNAQTLKYSIVSEQGASIYSCSDVAKKEFPNMDTNEISAVSIARRLNDPLSELVKIEPRHLGVGMYQHDVKEKLLTETLNEVVSECVSFVGVDINTASLSVLRHIAGLTEKRAEQIIAYRNEHGIFETREQLLKVKLIGAKTFVQCAGFVRIEAKSVGHALKNPLDSTWLHPESYDVAKKIIRNCKLQLCDVGTPNFIATIKRYAAEQTIACEALCAEFKLPKERLNTVLMALQRELLQDYRADLQKRPLFKQGILSIDDLSIGAVVTGAVNNITHFGAFVDIGVEYNALLHISKMNNRQLNIGDRIQAIITQIDKARSRIGLSLKKVLDVDDE